MMLAAISKTSERPDMPTSLFRPCRVLTSDQPEFEIFGLPLVDE